MGQPKRIIFDLSEVLIRGLVGIEEGARAGALPARGGDPARLRRSVVGGAGPGNYLGGDLPAADRSGGDGRSSSEG